MSKCSSPLSPEKLLLIVDNGWLRLTPRLVQNISDYGMLSDKSTSITPSSPKGPENTVEERADD